MGCNGANSESACSMRIWYPRKLAGIVLLQTGLHGRLQPLRRNTVAQTKTWTDIQYRQVMENLAILANNPDALPCYSVQDFGTAGVTDKIGNINGALTIPPLRTPGSGSIDPLWRPHDHGKLDPDPSHRPGEVAGSATRTELRDHERRDVAHRARSRGNAEPILFSLRRLLCPAQLRSQSPRELSGHDSVRRTQRLTVYHMPVSISLLRKRRPRRAGALFPGGA